MFIPAAYLVPHPPLIVPEVGAGQQRRIQATADSYHTVAKEIAALRPQTLVLFSPHAVQYADYIHISPGKGASGSLKQFGAPSVCRADYDTELVDTLCRLCDAAGFPAGTLGEKDPALDHGTLVPLYFINQYYTGYRLVRCSVAGLSRQEHYRFGMLVRQAVQSLGRRAVVVASGDLSHKLEADGPYGFVPEGPALDTALTAIVQSGAFGALFELDHTLCERGAECGLTALIALAGTLDKTAVQPRLLSYEGPFGVGYAVASFRAGGSDPERDFLEQAQQRDRRALEKRRQNEDPFTALARHGLEQYVITGTPPALPGDLPPELLQRQAGVFVSIKKNGALRGCIGTIAPTRANTALEILHNAVSAGTQDPRFPPVQPSELPDLVYSVDVLSPPEPIADSSLLDAQRYGVIVSCGNKRGLLLPGLEGVDTVEQQINIACQKAGIRPDERFSLERFEVVRHT